MPKLFYLLPSLGALIGILSVFITYYCLWRRLEKSKTLILQRLSQKFDNLEQQEGFSEILDDKLDGFIDGLRNQIPMGTMLLTQALSGKIKELAREGILKMMPDIKELLLNQLSQEMPVETIVLDILRPELCRIVIYAALLGFILGLLWLFGVGDLSLFLGTSWVTPL